MPLRVAASLLLLALAAPIAAAAPPPSFGSPLAAWTPQFQPGQCVVELTRDAAAVARLAFPAGAPAGSARAARLGLAALDQAAADLGGASFEPEFPAEIPPPAGSRAPDFTAFYVVHLAPGADPPAAARRFAAVPGVARASPVAIVPMLSDPPNDSLWSYAFHLDQPSGADIHARQAWDLTTGDSTIVIAILDTGIVPYHPDLGGTITGSAGNLWVNEAEEHGVPGVDDDHNGYVDDARGWDFVALPDSTGIMHGEDWRDMDNDPNDFAGHGTAVAGIADALSNNRIGITGAAWHLRLMPVRIGWSTESYPLGVTNEVVAARGVRYATRMGAAVINCSFATIYQPDLEAAVQAAVDTGVVIVAAAGNNGITTWITSREDVVAVAATDRFDVVAAFSNRGPEVDLAAPGQDLVTTVLTRPAPDSLGLRQPWYVVGASGTSFSTPLVAAAAGLVQSWRRQQGYPPLDPTAMLLRLRDSADDISGANSGAGYGTGRLNLYRALTDPERSRVGAIGSHPVGPPLVLPTGSGRPRVVIATESGRLLFLDGRDGDTLRVVLLPDVPIGYMAAADLGHGLGNGIFIPTAGGKILGYDATGDPLPGWPVSVVRSQPTTVVGGPAIGDLDGDGNLEIVAGTVDGALRAWEADGSPYMGFQIPGVLDRIGVSQPPALTPLGSEPGARIALISGNLVNVLRADGSEVPGWPYANGAPFTPPVVIATGADHAPTVFLTKLSQIVGLGPDGVARVTFPVSGIGRFEPAAGDLTGDGVDDLAFLLTGQSQLVVLDPTTGAGAPSPWPYDNLPQPLAGPLIARVAGGSRPDVIVNTLVGTLAFSSQAAPVPGFPPPFAAMGIPTVADVEGRGTAELIEGSARFAGGDPPPRLVVHETNAVLGPDDIPWGTMRGNMARTGSRLYAPPPAVIDDAPPPAVSDLAADSVGALSAALRWTAPALPHGTGGAAAYEIRSARVPLTEANFAFGTAEPGLAPPGPAGTPQRARVTTLVPDTTNYVAIRVRDRFGGWSPISTVLTLATHAIVPAPIADLRVTAATDTSIELVWTVTAGEDGLIRAAAFDLYGASAPIGQTGIAAATRLWTGVALAPGATQRLHLGGLTRARDYWLALLAEDAAGRRSPISNDALARTDVGGPLRAVKGVALAAGPQPARSGVTLYWRGAGGGAGRQIIQLFDLSGRMVQEIGLGAETDGITQWNGRDRDDRRAPAGIYFARLTSGSFHAQARVVLLP